MEIKSVDGNVSLRDTLPSRPSHQLQSITALPASYARQQNGGVSLNETFQQLIVITILGGCTEYSEKYYYTRCSESTVVE